MKPSHIPGIFMEKERFFTVNPKNCESVSVYGEQLRTIDEKEYRSWNPYRSKLASALLKGLKDISLTSQSRVLYLGAATGTTVSHFSDILTEGTIFAVEHSPIAAKVLIQLAKQRKNIIPIFADANHPEIYATILPKVDMVYQDISQRNQAEIFIRNMKQYMKPTGQGIIMVKARSIDVSLPPPKAYELVKKQISEQKFIVTQSIILSPYEKDHACLIVTPKK
jgi:fibrillarin-like pre-rRNA processing protein